MSSANVEHRGRRGESGVSMKFQKKEFSYEHPVAKPDPKKHRAAVAAVDARMEKLRDSRDKCHEESKALRQKALDAFDSEDAKTEFSTLIETSKELRGSINEINDRIDDAHKRITEQREIVNDLIRDLGSRSSENIDQDIARLQDEIAHTTLSRSEEQELVDTINKLKSTKNRLHDRDDAIAKRQEIQLEMEKLREKRNELYESKKELDAKFEATDEKYKPFRGKRDSLFERAKEIQEKGEEFHTKFVETRKERDQLWTEWKRINDEWYDEYKVARNAAYKKHRELEQARFEEWLAKADERKKIRRDRQLNEAQRPPFTEQIASCERCLEILQEMISNTRNKAGSVQGARDTEIPTEKIDSIRQSGKTILLSKKDHLNHQFAAQGGKSRRRRRNTTKPKGKSIESESEFDIISLSELLDLLTTLSVEMIPKNIGDCEDLVRQMHGKKKYYDERTSKIIEDNVAKLKERWVEEDAAEEERKKGKKQAKGAEQSVETVDEESVAAPEKVVEVEA